MKLKLLALVTAAIFSSSTLAQDNDNLSNGVNAQNPPTTQFNTQQIEGIQKVIHNYLINHPEVLIEVSQVLQAKENAKTERQTKQAIEQNKDKLFSDSRSPTAGNPQGTVTLVEFFDYQCSHCKETQPVVAAIIDKNKNLKVVFKELPIFGGDSQYAAMAALASVKQGKFQAFHDALLKAENPLNKDKIMSVAKKVGIDTKQLTQDMDSSEIKKQVRDNFQLAQKLKLVGTPSFIIANKNANKFDFIPGQPSQSDLQQKIDSVSK